MTFNLQRCSLGGVVVIILKGARLLRQGGKRPKQLQFQIVEFDQTQIELIKTQQCLNVELAHSIFRSERPRLLKREINQRGEKSCPRSVRFT